MTLPATTKDSFLDHVMNDGNIARAAERLGINRVTLYRWRDADLNFAEKWEHALDISRQNLRENVIETATALGIGMWVPVVDTDTGDIALNDDFEPLMRFETGNVDARVLMKLMDKTMRDEVRMIDKRTAIAGQVHHTHEDIEVELINPDGSIFEPHELDKPQDLSTVVDVMPEQEPKTSDDHNA